MITTEKANLTAQVTVNAPVEKVWEAFTNPEHITRWNFASDDWCCPRAENDLRVGGKLKSRMEARDGSMGFDFEGEYTSVEPHRYIEFVLGDGRKVQLTFTSNGDTTEVIEKFEAEEMNPLEMQQEGWQAILNNFKKHVETSGNKEKLHYELYINAPTDQVYQKMLGEESYKEWTSAFNPTSQYKGSWEKGSKILFLGTDEQGNHGGMVARIKENIPNRFVSIEHIGIVAPDGQEITSGPDVEQWAGALENYTFTEVNCHTMLSIDVDTNTEYKAYFEDTWPKALQKLKDICEQQ